MHSRAPFTWESTFQTWQSSLIMRISLGLFKTTWCSREYILIRLLQMIFESSVINVASFRPIVILVSLNKIIVCTRYGFQCFNGFISSVCFLYNHLIMHVFQECMTHWKTKVTTVCLFNCVNIIWRKLVGSVCKIGLK